MDAEWDVVVVGSCMIDLICYAPRLPKSGETLKGSDLCQGFGGKGCNQCVAAKKLGAKTLLVARVGDDFFGKNYISKMQDIGIPTNHMRVTEGVTSGMAQITVADNGENHIVIVPGANEKLSEKDLTDVEEEIRQCKVLLCQLEINWDCTVRAMEMKSRAKKGKIVLNGAPAVSDPDPRTFSIPDIFCVNESEAEVFTGRRVRNVEEAKNTLQELIGKGCQEVIITLGEQGAVYGVRGSDEVIHVPAERVTPVDTTGAGDAFIGALAYYMSNYPKLGMPEVIRRACSVASLSVQRKGTQESFPWISQLQADQLGSESS